MPNGGMHHCGHCKHYEKEAGHCGLRQIPIKSPHWTTCRNFNHPSRDSIGPLYAIVCEVKDGAGGYREIPYFEGIRVDTVQKPGGGDTVVCFTDREGIKREFLTVDAYLSFYQNHAPLSDREA